VVPAAKNQVSVLNTEDGVLITERQQNKSYVDYIKARTVSVKLDCEPKKGIIFMGDYNPSRAFDSRGTGVILRSYESGSYIVTAAHVVFPGVKYRSGLDCKIYVQEDVHAHSPFFKLESTIISYSEYQDLAILRVNENLMVSSDLVTEPFVGERVWSSGYPAIRANRSVFMSVTTGTLSTVFVTSRGRKFHRISAPVYSGNSGGPIWNAEGKLVGITLLFYGLPTEHGPLPFEGEYYIRPIDEVVKLTEIDGVFSEVFEN
jgi:S1-C subfamily serine protease